MFVSRHRLVLLVLILALLATACRSGADDTSGEDEAAGGTTDTATEETAAAATDAGTEAGGGAAGDVQTGEGVTSEPCPDAVNPDNGCIYLGILSDLSEGPFSAQGPVITDAQEAFWNRVNEDGGISGYDVNVTEYTRDNKYNPQVTTQVYEEIKPHIAGIAQTLGSPPTAAIIEDVAATPLITAPATWSSLWLFQDVVLESGNPYCLESANGIDWALENPGTQVGPTTIPEDVQSVMAVYYPGEFGEDGAAGVQAAAENAGLEFTAVATEPGPDNQTGAISQIVQQNPDIVYMTAGPTDVATLVGQATAQGFEGVFMTQAPGFNEGLVQSPAADALEGLIVTGPNSDWAAETPGHEAMREAIGENLESSHVQGWVWSYPILAALQQAADNGDLTRQGILDAALELGNVDYEGMLPEGAGNYSGSPDEMAVRASVIQRFSAESETVLEELSDGFYTGPTAESYSFDGPCYEDLT